VYEVRLYSVFADAQADRTPMKDELPCKSETIIERTVRGILRDSLHGARQADAENAVRLLLGYIGQDPNSDGLKDTPERVVRALAEMTAGYGEDPKEILGTVFEVSYDQVV